LCRTATKTDQWTDPHVSLARIYDEDGNEHSWKILINETGDVITVADINKLLSSGKKFTENIIDKQCTKCELMFSNIGSLDEGKILESLHIKSIINNFFRFYEKR